MDAPWTIRRTIRRTIWRHGVGEAPSTLKGLQRMGRGRQLADLSGVSRAAGNDQSARRAGVGRVGFTRDMLYLLEQKRPDYLFVAFDGPEPTFRHEMYEAYKAQPRRDARRTWCRSTSRSARLLAGLNVPVLDCEATRPTTCWPRSPTQVNERDGECYVVTGDKDCRQLITDRVKVYNIRKDQMYDAEALKAGLGHPARPGRRFSGAGGRFGRQRAGRAADRSEGRRRVLAKIRHARQPARSRRRAAQGETPRQPDQHARAGAAQPRAGAARSPRAGRDRLERRAGRGRRPPGAGRAVHRIGLSHVRRRSSPRCRERKPKSRVEGRLRD